MINDVPDGWEDVPFTQALDSVEVKKQKVLARHYLPSGKYPIVDQGQKLIAGWTNDESVVITKGLPYIVFGDHTRAFKFVDQPFALGADGTQLLKPTRDFYPRFFYYACLALDIPSRGYNRHFTLLKERSLLRPRRMSEQVQIADMLRSIERAIDVEQHLLRELQRLKQLMMADLFAGGLHNHSPAESEGGRIPENWDAVKVIDEWDLVAGGTPDRKRSEYWRGGDIPWVKTGEVNYTEIVETEESITPAGLANSSARLLPPSTLLMAMYGQGVTRGKVAILGVEAATNQACIGFLPRNSRTLPRFLYHYLTFAYDRVRGLAHGGQQQNLNKDIVGSITYLRPPESEQREIVDLLDLIDRNVTHRTRKRALLVELFRTLLLDLVSGRRRIAYLPATDDGELTA